MQDGRTALYIATQEGHEDIVRLLLEARADPDVFQIWNTAFWGEDSTDPIRMPVIFGGRGKLCDPGMHVRNKVC